MASATHQPAIHVILNILYVPLLAGFIAIIWSHPFGAHAHGLAFLAWGWLLMEASLALVLLICSLLIGWLVWSDVFNEDNDLTLGQAFRRKPLKFFWPVVTLTIALGACGFVAILAVALIF